jgi:hypothetical protein
MEGLNKEKERISGLYRSGHRMGPLRVPQT